MLRQKFFLSCLVSTVLIVAVGSMLGQPALSVSEQTFWQYVQTDRLLDQPVGLSAVDQPLAEVLQSLADRYDVPIRIPSDSLTGRQSVTIDAHRLRLRSLLSLILEPHGLDFAVEQQQIIVSPVGAQGDSSARLIARVYPLPRPPAAWHRMDEQHWSELIQIVVAPSSWHRYDGGGTIVALPGALVIVHLPAVHQQVMELLVHLERCHERVDPTSAIRLTDHTPSSFEQRLRKILAEPCQVEFFRADLPTALGFLSRQFDLPIVISPLVQQNKAVMQKGTVTIHARRDSLATVLNEILDPWDLSFRIRHDVIEITFRDLQPSEYRLYPLDDLVTRSWVRRHDSEPARGLREFLGLSDGGQRPADFTAYDLGDHMLLVEATVELHDRLARFLDDLRGALVGLRPTVLPTSRAIRWALAQPAHLEFVDSNLTALVAWIGRVHSIPLEIDPLLRDAARRQITGNERSERLVDALRRLLGTAELELVILPDRLLVTDRQRAVEFRQNAYFDVRPLVDPDWGVMTERTLIPFLSAAYATNESQLVAASCDGVLIVRASQSQLLQVAEAVERLNHRLDSLPKDREFSAAHRRGQTPTADSTADDEESTLRRLYFQALRACIDESPVPE